MFWSKIKKKHIVTYPHLTRFSAKMVLVHTAVYILVLCIISLFAALNYTDVQIHYLFGQIHLPLCVALVLSLLIGLLLGSLYSVPKLLALMIAQMKMRAKIRKLAKTQQG